MFLKNASHYTFVDYASQAYSAVAMGFILLFHNQTVPHWPWLAASHGLGIMVVHGLIRWNGRGRSWPAVDFLRHFYPVLLYLWFFWETGLLNRMFFTEYMDPLAIQWDQALFGCQPSVLFMEKLPWLPLSEVFYASYFSYYLMIGGVGFALFVRDRRQFFHYISVVSFVFYLCYVVYILLPIIGPRVFLQTINGYTLPEAFLRMSPSHTYPEAVQRGLCFHVMGLIYNVFESPGAALPSSHVAVAICTVHFSFRYLRAIRYPHLVLAILLCLSTLYCRYHYGVDVMAGVLTAAVLIPVGNRLYFRFQKSAGQPGETPVA
jgi:membrane-associated phospholipid phosphatase